MTALLSTITDGLAAIYPWTKALHIVAVITWMAGIFYLPRLFVYHVERAAPSQGRDDLREPHASLVIMERKLLRFIMNPAMIAVWIFGLMLVFTPQAGVYWDEIWPWTKAFAVLAMTWFHHWLGRRRKELARGTNSRSGKTYRMMNEVPTLLLLVIVFSVVLKF